MVTIRIGNESRKLEEADPQWINQQISGRRRAGEDPCVSVHIDEPGVRMTLMTPNCRSGGGRWTPNREENAAHELWKKFDLHIGTFDGGQIVAFLMQLSQLLGLSSPLRLRA